MALDLGISLKVETSSLEEAMKKVNALGDAVSKVGKEIKSSATGTSKATQESNKAIERSASTAEKSTKKVTSVLERQRLIAQFLAGDFTKGEASILATGKAAGLSNKQMKELENTLKQIFKLSGKNPFDDSVDPLRRLTAESEKLVNKMKVLRGETTLTAKQLEELTIRQARVEASARAQGLRGAALQSTINKATKEYISLAEKVNSQQAKYNLELENTKNNRKAEESVLRGISTGILGAIKQQEKLKKLVEETELKSRLMQQGLSTTTANMVVRAVRGGASESGPEVASLIASRKAIESVNESKKKLAETSSATYQAIVEGNKKAKFHIDGLQAAVRAVIPGFGALSAVAIGSTVIAGAIRMADAYTALQSRIKLTGVTSEQLQIVNERLLRISNESRTSLAENTQLYVKLANALKNFGGTSVDALNVTSAFSKALVIGGANTREASAATLQFAQALGSGKLAGDEFRSIAEASPRVLKAIADGSGIAADKLKKMASEGMLTTSVVAKALISQLAVLEAEMLSLTPTIGQAFQVLTNNTTSLIGKLNEATGFTRAVAEGVLGLANSIPTADQVIKTVTDSVRGFGKILQENKDLIEGFVGSLITVAAPFVVMKTVTIASTLAFAGLSATIKAATAIMAAYRGVMIAVALAGGGLTGVMTLLTAAMTLFAKNRAVLVLTTLGSVLAYAFSDQISAMIQKVTDKLAGFNSEVEKTQNAGERLGVGARSLTGNELQRKLEEIRAENIKTKKLLGMDLTKEEKSSEKKSEAQGYSDVRDFVKDQINLLKQRKDLTEEQFQSEARNIVALAEQLKLKQDLAKVSLTESKEDKKGIFNLANINKIYETEIQQSNKLFDFRRDLIDKNLQYELVTAGVAEIQKQRLAEETYNRERELLEKQLKEVSALKPNAKLGSDQFETQKEAIETQKKVLDEKIKTLDIDRQRTVEIAKVVALGESEKKALEARRDLAKIEADIREDINRKQQEFNNRFADPAVLAAEQARLQAADKYTQKIAEAQQVIQRIKTLQDNQALVDPEDAKTTSEIANELSRMEEILKRLVGDQKRFGDEAANSAKSIVEQSRSLEEGFRRAIRNRQNDLNDLSKVSENFMNGFYSSFDAALEKSVKEFRFKFGSVFKFIRDELKKILIQRLVLTPIKMVIEPIIQSMGQAMLGLIFKAATAAFAQFVALLQKDSIVDTLKDFGSSIFSGASSLFGKVGSFFEGGFSSFSKIPELFSKGFVGLETAVYNGFASSLNAVGITGTSNIALSTAGTAAAGLAAGYGINRTLAGGYEVGGAVGNIAKNGATIGAIVGSILPGIGTFVGGIVGGAIGGAVNGLFGKKVTQTAGIEGTISSEGFTGQNFVETVTKRRFRSTKVNTQYSALEQQYESTLDAAIALTFQSSRELIKLLGAGSEEAINTYTESGRFFIRNTEELQSTLVRLSNTLLDKAVPSLKGFQREGETLAQTAIRVANTISGLNNLTQLIGNASKFTFETFGSGENLVKSLQNEDFQRALDFYVQNFADKADVFKAKSDAFNFQVQQLGLSLETLSASSTKQDFSSLIKGLDLTSEEGQQLLGGLLSLSPALKEIIDLRAEEEARINQQIESVEQAYARLKNVIKTNEAIAQERINLEEELFSLTASSTEIRQREREALDSSNRALYDQIKAIEDQRLAAEEAARVAEEIQQQQQRILEERKSLEEELFNLTAGSVELAQKERQALDESNRAIFDQIQLVKSQKEEQEKLLEIQKKISDERLSLEEELFNLISTPEEILNKQRQALDESNRSLFDQIQLIKKKKETEEKAIKDVTDAYNRERDSIVQVRDKLKGFADTLADYRNELLSSSGTLTGQQQLDIARSRFESTVQALGSSDEAVRDKAFADFTNVSNAFLEASREFSDSYVNYLNDFSRVSGVLSQTESKLLNDISVQEEQLGTLKEMVSGIISVDESVKSLSETLRFYFTGTAAEISTGTSAVTPLNITAPTVQQAQLSNSIMENQLSILNAKVQQLIEENRINAQQIALNTGKTAKILERADDGDSINVRVVVD